MNTTDFFLRSVNDADLAFIHKGDQISYRCFKSLCWQSLLVLQQAEIKPGDKVAIWGENSVYWAAAYLAIIKLGAVAVPLSTLLIADTFISFMKFSECKFLFVDKYLHHKYAKCCDEFSFHLLGDGINKDLTFDWQLSDSNFDIDSDAVLMFTSGTTSKPRAVRITHRNLQANTNSIVHYLELSSKDRIMIVLPFYYCFGASLLHTHLFTGASMVISTSFNYPENVLKVMEETECTGFAGVPTTYQILLRNSTFPDKPLPHLKKIQQAGGKLHDKLLSELIDSHPNAKIFVMYGQTEATARLSYLPPELLHSKLGSIGKGIPGVMLSVRNEDGSCIAPGEVGEIIARGDNISPGYYKDDEATKEKFINGDLHTGDMATVDDEGFIYIVDRKSDFIKSYGHRVSSYEIESCVMQISDVIAVAAVGVPDEYAGEKIRLYIVLHPGSCIDITDIMKICRSQLAKYMWPQEVIFTTSLPMNAHGKVIKSELRAYGIK